MSSILPRPARLAPLALLALVGACASPPEAPVATASTPPLVLEQFFPGRTVGQGVFTNSWTGSQRRFDVVIDGAWDGKTLTLVEDFAYADGEKDRKTWKLERTAPGTYTGTREDVVGPARAWTEGKAVRLEYAVSLGGWTVDFRDVLALNPDGSLINKATVGKWGLRVGRVELELRRAPGS
ncbi:DUF3833 domain-containing protein [Reyranella aquatilis]|uniref:DUF3833 domain-containing protein n=1 Tax=Reyranella aquatilis TaxID=2035356 RepID=A0ABS8L2H7_9HYPH|nr:DUF3833 family protein [Reyranella aquatilis]MCC8432551.1 DUF3833 domain-containing protein [Reyranella aquatilis]